MVSLENIHTNNTIWAEQVLFSNKQAYTNIYMSHILYMSAVTITEKEVR